MNSQCSLGDSFIVVKDDATAKQIAEIRLVRHRESELAKSSKVSLTELYDKIQSGAVKELNIIIKGDVHGSVEVAIDSLEKLGKNYLLKINSVNIFSMLLVKLHWLLLVF